MGLEPDPLPSNRKAVDLRLRRSDSKSNEEHSHKLTYNTNIHDVRRQHLQYSKHEDGSARWKNLLPPCLAVRG